MISGVELRIKDEKLRRFYEIPRWNKYVHQTK